MPLPNPGTHVPTYDQAVAAARNRTLTADELDAFVAAGWKGGFLAQVFITSQLVPLFTIIKIHDPALWSKIHYNPGQWIGITTSNGDSVYPLTGVSYGSVSHQLNELFQGLPIIGPIVKGGEAVVAAGISVTDFLGRLGSFIFSVRFPEFIVGGILFTIGLKVVFGQSVTAAAASTTSQAGRAASSGIHYTNRKISGESAMGAIGI